jgi:3-methyladenine DNA glycosylase/8-oxoguanine DNA glycosylase
MPTVKLTCPFDFEIKPIPPYSFDLTIRKPAGWPLFTPLEIYEEGTLWTAVHLNSQLVGVKLNSKGTPDRPNITAKLFLKHEPGNEAVDAIKTSLIHCIGADDDLQGFYALAKTDSILKYATADLYGMHSTSTGDTVFPDALLAILLQMAPLNRSNNMMDCIIKKYGETAEFDGRKVPIWPLPKELARKNPESLAETCKIGYRAKRIVELSKKLVNEDFPHLPELEKLSPEEAKCRLLELPGIGDYSADIINPHGGFPIDVWSVEVFGKLFFGKEPENNRQAVEEVKREGIRRWGQWSWMAFYYVVQDLENLSKSLGVKLRLA